MKTFNQWPQETTLYHGTQKDFQTLEPRKARFGTGISFTNNPEVARNYGLGRYKGGKKSNNPVVKTIDYSGASFNFYEPVPERTVSLIKQKLNLYLSEFTPDKKDLFLKQTQGLWARSGKDFYREIQRSFAKRGTDQECKLAKSRNNNLEICQKCSAFDQMPDLLNQILLDIGYDSLCYDDTNDGVSHRCYFLMHGGQQTGQNL
jgi:hypothetical protein